MIRSGLFVFTRLDQHCDRIGIQRDARGISRINEEERLDFGIFQLFEIGRRELISILALWRGY